MEWCERCFSTASLSLWCCRVAAMDSLRKGRAAAPAAAAETAAASPAAAAPPAKPRADCRLALRASLYSVGFGTKEGLLALNGG